MSYQVEVAAEISAGQAVASSAISDVVAPAPAPQEAPVNTGAPSIGAGDVEEGEMVFIGNEGSWSGNPTPSLTVQWYGCRDLQATDCVAIAGATSDTLDMLDGDDAVGAYWTYKLVVTASNGVGGPVTASAYAIDWFWIQPFSRPRRSALANR